MYCSENQLSFEIKTLSDLQAKIKIMNSQKKKPEDDDKEKKQVQLTFFDDSIDNDFDQQKNLKRSSRFKKKKNLQQNSSRNLTSFQNDTQGDSIFFTQSEVNNSQIKIPEKKVIQKQKSVLPQVTNRSIQLESNLLSSRMTISKNKQNDKFSIMEQNSQFMIDKTKSGITMALPKLKEKLQMHSEKQISELFKLNKMTNDKLDQLKNENNKLQEQLNHLMKIRENGLSKEKAMDMKIQIKEKLNKIEDKIEQTEQNLEQNERQALHMNKILLICNINVQFNQEWIKALNFFMVNLKKLIQYETIKINQKKDKISVYEKMIDKYQEEYQNSLNMHDKFIGEISLTINKKKTFDNQYSKTDQLIEQSSQVTVHEIKIDRIEKKSSKTEQVKQRRDSQKMLLQLQNQEILISQQQQKLQQLSEIFQVKIGKEDFKHTKQFQLFQCNWEKKTELEAIIDDLAQKKKQLENKIQIITVKKNYLEKASKPQQELEQQNIQKQKANQETLQKLIQDCQKQKIDTQSQITKYQEAFVNIKSSINNLLKKTYTQDETYQINYFKDFEYQKFKAVIEERIIFIKQKIGEQKFQEVLNGKNSFGEYEILYENYNQESELDQKNEQQDQQEIESQQEN